jgi:hypothetical protein
MRVELADVTEVRLGASARGTTLVQLLLKDKANVETVQRAVASKLGLARFNDPVLARLTAAATAKVIVA